MLQVPTITICPGRNLEPDSWGYVEKLYTVINGSDPETQDIFGFMAEALLDNRIETNLASMRNLTSEAQLMDFVGRTFRNQSTAGRKAVSYLPGYGVFMLQSR